MSRSKITHDVRNEVLILTNGKESEKNYFDLINKYYKSEYKINIEFLNGDPLYLANYAIGKNNKYNQIWIVVDVDDFQDRIVETRKKIKKYKNSINLILSNRSFEVWLLNHFSCFKKNCGKEELKKEINTQLTKLKWSKSYEKSDIDLLETHFIHNLEDAVKNSKFAYQSLKKDYLICNNKNPDDLDLISITQVYQLNHHF